MGLAGDGIGHATRARKDILRAWGSHIPAASVGIPNRREVHRLASAGLSRLVMTCVPGLGNGLLRRQVSAAGGGRAGLNRSRQPRPPGHGSS